MIIGVPKEIKPGEHRVSLTPTGAGMLTKRGHTVIVESKAGIGSGFTAEEYKKAGATVVETAKEVFNKAEMIIKVKEPLESEYKMTKEGQILFTYFHFAASRELTDTAIGSKTVAIAYETVETVDSRLPLLTPMSEVAGRMSIQQCSKYLGKAYGGSGILIGGVPGVDVGTVLILGAGVVGTYAAKAAAGLGAIVYILDVNLERLRYLSDTLPANVVPMMSNPTNIRDLIQRSDLVVSSVLIKGGKAPKLITREMLKTMKPGSLIVDVAIDQGGTTETSQTTTHEDPVYEVDGILHYCVGNMPGAMPNTSTKALTNATLPYIMQIAQLGWKKAMIQNRALAKGANIINGHITCENLANSFDMHYTPIEEILETTFSNACFAA